MRPLATLRRAHANRLSGPRRNEATALLACALQRLTAGDSDGASSLLAAAHGKSRNSALLHTGVHVGELVVALRRRRDGTPADLPLQPLLLAGLSSWLRRAAALHPDAPQEASLWRTWQSRPREP